MVGEREKRGTRREREESNREREGTEEKGEREGETEKKEKKRDSCYDPTSVSTTSEPEYIIYFSHFMVHLTVDL